MGFDPLGYRKLHLLCPRFYCPLPNRKLDGLRSSLKSRAEDEATIQRTRISLKMRANANDATPRAIASSINVPHQKLASALFSTLVVVASNDLIVPSIYSIRNEGQALLLPEASERHVKGENSTNLSCIPKTLHLRHTSKIHIISSIYPRPSQPHAL